MAKVRFEPSGHVVEIDETTTVREAAHMAGVNVHDRCGGLGACCNCMVTVVQGMENICPRTVIEDALFSLAENDRLSCQCRISGDIVVSVF